MGFLESEDYEQSLNGMSEWYCGSWTLCPDEADHQKTNTLKCMRARETASAHASLQACTDLVHACTYDCTPAQASCTHAHRFASQHATVHTSTRLVQASTSLCTPAHESACMHVADARMQIRLQASTVLCRHANRFASEHADMQACTDLVHACM